ncbi:MAG: RING finger protein [Sphaerochaeta sp.]
MAYCVQCGVKLADGSTECPLCKTPVLLPPGVVEEVASPLFAQELEPAQKEGLSKARKGILELMIALGTVAFISVGLALALAGHRKIILIPLAAIVSSIISLSYGLMGKKRYINQATVHLGVSGFLLLVIDASLGALNWSLITTLSIALFWVIGVFPFTPWPKRGVGVKITTTLIAILGYLAALNFILSSALTWFIPVALPIWLTAIVTLGILLFILAKRRVRSVTIGEVVLSTLFIVFITLTVFDLLLTHYLKGLWALRWASALLVGSLVVLFLLLALNLSIRVRRYFTSIRREK